MRLMLPIVAALALGAGCAGTGSVGYTAAYSAPAPDLVYVSPGVSVIADYEQPIFYSDGYYWRHDGGYWYRSSAYTHGWVYARPPRAILSVGDPYRYVRYRPSRQVVYRDRYNNRPVYRPARPVMRDHRYDRGYDRGNDRRTYRDRRDWRDRDRRDNRRDRRIYVR